MKSLVKLKAIIVDDEENARLLLQKLLEELNAFGEIRLARSSSEALTEIRSFEPDIVFLDIKMPGRDGFDFISDLPERMRRPDIVFVTAHDEYALKAIKNRAFDYLLKPVNREELRLCVQRSIEKKHHELRNDTSDKPSKIKINTRTGTVFINPESILYCRADGNYTVICTGSQQHTCSLNLGRIEDMLPRGNYFRIGRSYIINRDYLTVLNRKDSTLTLLHDGAEATIKIPRQYLTELETL